MRWVTFVSQAACFGWTPTAFPTCGVLAGNSQHLQSIISLAAALRSALEPPGTSPVQQAQHSQHAQQAQQSQAQQQIQTVNDFLFRTQLDGVNMFKLVR